MLEQTNPENVTSIPVEHFRANVCTSNGFALVHTHFQQQPLFPAVSIQNGSFAWSENQKTPTLSNVDVRIPRGKLVAIVGQVCGLLLGCHFVCIHARWAGRSG